MDNLDFNFFCKKCTQSKEYRLANCFTHYIIKNYNKGDYIAFKGEKVRDLALLVSGSLTVEFVLPSGIVMRSMVHQAPYPIGALALLGQENKYRVDVVANKECSVISVARTHIEQQIMSCRDFMLSFIDYSSSKVDSFVDQISIVSQRNISSKLAYYILYCSPDGKHYTFKKSIIKLSEYIFVERPSLSRTIGDFVNKGIITYKNGSGEILNINELKRLVE